MINNQKILYQYGEYVFKQEGLDYSFSRGVKTQNSDSPLMNGDIRENGLKQDFLAGTTLDVSFLIDYNDDLDKISYEFFQGVKPVYFYTYPNTRNPNFRFLFNYASCVEPLTERLSSNEQLGQDYRIVTTKLKLLYPFCGLCDNNLSIIDYNVPTRTFGGVGYFGDNGFFGGDGDTIPVNTLSVNQIQSYIDDDRKYQLLYKDNFLQPTYPTIDSDNAFTFNLSTNNQALVDTQAMNLKSLFPSFINLIRLNGSFSAGESVTFDNPSTKTGFVFTWKKATTSPILLINTFNYSVYDLSNLVQLNPYNGDYTITTTYDVNMLSFSSLLKSPAFKQNFYIQKQTANNLNITIKNLPLF